MENFHNLIKLQSGDNMLSETKEQIEAIQNIARSSKTKCAVIGGTCGTALARIKLVEDGDVDMSEDQEAALLAKITPLVDDLQAEVAKFDE